MSEFPLNTEKGKKRPLKTELENSIDDRTPDILGFLGLLFNPFSSLTGAHIEVRTFLPDHALTAEQRNAGPRDWFPITQSGYEAAARGVAEWSKNHDVYFGVLPRRHGGGKAGDVKLAACIWADIDAGDEDFDAAIALLADTVKQKGLPRPDAIVRSGGGVHAYWKLSESVKCATTQEQTRVRQVMVRLVRLIGGELDHAHACPKANDVARVLRLPGSFNHKIPGEPRRVDLVRIYHGQEAHSLTWWEAFLPAIPLPPPYIPQSYGNGNRQREQYPPGSSKGGLMPATVRKITGGAADGTKHYTMVAVATAARKQGLCDEEIWAAAEAFGRNSGVNMGDPAQQRHLQGVVEWAVRNVMPDPL